MPSYGLFAKGGLLLHTASMKNNTYKTYTVYNIYQ